MLDFTKYDLSIVVPIYNVEKYIEEALDSILNQDTQYSFQVVLVDDGSTDKTVEILKKYVAENTNFYLYEQLNQGAGSARNMGIEKSNSEYIYFFDSDDYLLQNAIQKCVSTMKQNNLDMILFSGQSFKDEGSKESNFFPSYRRDKFKNIPGRKFLEYSEKNKSYSVQPCLYMSKLKNIRENNLFFPTGIIYEDNYFTTVNLILSEKVTSIDDIFYMRRIREGSVMTSRNKVKSLKSLNEVVKSFRNFYDKNNIDITKVKIVNYMYYQFRIEYKNLSRQEKSHFKGLYIEINDNFKHIKKNPFINEIRFYKIYIFTRILSLNKVKKFLKKLVGK